MKEVETSKCRFVDEIEQVLDKQAVNYEEFKTLINEYKSGNFL